MRRLYAVARNTPTAQRDQKKMFRARFVHSRAWRKSEGSSPLYCSAGIPTSGLTHLHASLVYACMYTTLAICKTRYLVQTDQAR